MILVRDNNRRGDKSAYTIDVTNVINDLDGCFKDSKWLPSGGIYTIHGILNTNIIFDTIGSSFIFDDLKLDGGTLSLTCFASKISFKEIENINNQKKATFNLLSKRSILIEDNSLNSECTVNLTVYNHPLSKNMNECYTFNLNNQKKQTPNKLLVQTLMAIKEKELEKIRIELEAEKQDSYLKKIQRRISTK